MMKNIVNIILLVSLLSVWSGEAMARACTSSASGNWSNIGTWTCSVGNRVPTTADTVTIASGFPVTVDVVTANVTTVTVNSGGILTQSNTLNDAGTLSVAGTLTSTAAMAITGATSVTGSLAITSGAVARIFTGLVTVSGGGTWNNSGNQPVTFQGGLTNNGGTFTAGSGTQTFSTSSQAIGGTTAIIIPNLTVTGVTLTNNGTLTASTTLAGTGGLTNSAAGILNIGGSSTITTLTATAAGNTVNYTGAGQTVTATTYSNLNVTGTATNSGTVIVNTALGGAGTLINAAAGVLNIGGTSAITTLTASAAGNTVNYTGAAQTVMATAYSNLGLSGSGAVNLAGVTTIGGNLTLSGTATATEAAALMVGGNLTIGASNTFTNSTYALNVAGNYTENGTFTAGTGVLTLNGGVAVQTISGTATIGFTNLTVSNTGGILLAQNVTVTSAIIGTVTLTSTCPINYTITSNNGGTVQESCTPVCNPPPNVVATGLAVTCVCDNFGRANLNPSTIFGGTYAISDGTSDLTGVFPYINGASGYLRLTENTGNNAKAATVPSIFPAAGNYISVEFNHYAYNSTASGGIGGGSGNTGADGIAVTLSDYSIPAVPGGFGGSLGYAQSTGSTPNPPGFAGGWIGVGLDEYGNYQNTNEGRQLGPNTSIYQSVAMRGPGSGMNGYRWMAGTGSNPGGFGISNSASTTPAPGYMYQVIVDARNESTGTINVSVNRDTTTKNGNTYTSLFGPFNAYTEANYAVGQNWITQIVPNFWKISFTGSTGGSNNIHEIGGLRICAQSIAPATGGTASGFSAIDNAYPGAPPAYPNFQTGHIYTKLVGTAFNLYVAALTPTAISTAYSSAQSQYVQVKFVDNSASAGNLCGSNAARTCNNACTSQAAVEAGATQIASFIKPSATGVASPSPAFTLKSAYQNLVAVMQECTTSTCVAFTATTPACSADSFSVRPLNISSVISSNATNTTTAGLPKFKAGSDNFNLTATTTGVAGFPSKYTGVLKINSTLVSPAAPATVAGVVSGTFAAATSATPSSTAIGNVFTYSEVGDFSLLANGVYDGVSTPVECTTPGLTTAQCDTLKAATWTGVDSVSTQGDCVADSFSNVINASGQYGCNFGYSSATGVLGRFTPDHFTVSATSLYNRSDICLLGCGTFTYMGEQMTAVFTLTAQSAGGSTTKNYVGNNSAGQLAKLNPAAAGNPLGLAVAYAAVSSAAAGAGATTVSVNTTVGFVAGDALWIPGAGAAGAALNATVASLTSNTITLSTPIVTAVPLGTNIERDLTASLNTSTAATGSFAAGVAANISAPLTVNRGTTNYYPALNVGIAPVDSDGVSMAVAALNLDAAYVAGNDHASIGSTDVRYGLMKLTNAHGSELLQLPITVKAQYWNGLNYATNIADSITTLNATTVTSANWTNLTAGNWQQLSTTSTWAAGATSVVPATASVVFVNGVSSFKLAAPGSGKTGSVDMTTNAPTYLLTNTTARATFGVYKGANEVIYQRENY
jgi:MSHA biogenesis protein MshQ